MATKSATKPPAKPARLSRKGTVPVADLLEMASKAERLSGSLRAIADRAKEAGIEVIEVDGLNAFDRGVVAIKVFITGASRAVEMAID